MPVDDDLDLDTEKAQPPKKGSLKKIILWSVIGLLLIGGGTAGGLYFTGLLPGFSAHGEDSADSTDPNKKGAKAKNGKQKEPKEPPKPVIYQAMEPPFVVNFYDQAQVRFLQVTMEVSARDPLVIEAVKTHMPVIRNNLVMLLASQTYAGISTREGKEKLRTDTLAEIQKILTEQTGKPGVEAVYFTSFVMQ